jgi:A/G-specific adenine glycosylase
MPWRETRNPYRILVSEVMLQQTSVARVIDKYRQFIRRFPSVRSLAGASTESLLGTWKGLGYNRRALALRAAAQTILSTYNGRVPRTLDELVSLPGIGRATACAVLAYAHETALPFVETNIRRVFLHFYFPGQERVPDERILPLVEKTLDHQNPREWYYALMDYGAVLGRGAVNANKRSAHYQRQKPFEGSLRQLRGSILAAMLTMKKASAARIREAMGTADPRFEKAISQLVEEGFLARRGKLYYFR